MTREQRLEKLQELWWYLHDLVSRSENETTLIEMMLGLVDEAQTQLRDRSGGEP